jgi:hypothetical protein|tara:strand:- start:455 stop:1684 length:1230 start_codon:yes stop_codon:yes gene_type:complete
MQLCQSKKVLFLIRAYNDLDHIAPVIWKMASAGFRVGYLLTGREFLGDYRIKIIEEASAKRMESVFINQYYARLRPRVKPKILRRAVDWLIALVVGSWFLKSHDIGCVIVEWAGPSGRDRAPFLLRAARRLGLPTISIPHGYHTWLRNDFNTTTREAIETTGELPQLTDRNRFSAYVVQSENIKRYCIESGIREKKIHTLGSARFCAEWSQINYNRCLSMELQEEDPHGEEINVLFFLNHWNYNVDRHKCFALLKRLCLEENVRLIIKGHTRGRVTGGLNPSEESILDQSGRVVFPNENIHSPQLVKNADLVIVYGSSICFEALRQCKPVCWPRFICPNLTIFDQSGLVSIAQSEDEVVGMIRAVENGEQGTLDESSLDEFFRIHVEGGSDDTSVLQRYSDVISSFLST